MICNYESYEGPDTAGFCWHVIKSQSGKLLINLK